MGFQIKGSRSTPLSRCAITAGGSHPLYFDLNWRSVRNYTSLPSVTLSASTPRLPLVHTCGNRVQPDSLDCTVDPVSYVSGSPFSIDVHAP
jgi:hypothetical protein